MASTIQICGTCIFFQKYKHDDKKGECRKNPPTVFYAGYDPVSLFPEMETMGWCGEWRENKEVVDKVKKYMENQSKSKPN